MDIATDHTAERGRVAADAARIYDRDFVPALFEPWVDAVLDVGAVGHGDRVVDIGCGTGILARSAADRVGSSGSVVGVDPNPGMLTVAADADDRIDWRVGTAEALPVDDASVDVAASQFAVMFFDDHHAAALEIERVLRPGGRLVVAAWAGIDRNSGFSAMHRLFVEVLGPELADGLLVPFSIPTPEALATTLAGTFPDVVVTEHVRDAHFRSIAHWVHTEIRGWTLATHIDPDTEDLLVAEAQRRWRHLTHSDGSVRFPSPALLARARKPT